MHNRNRLIQYLAIVISCFALFTSSYAQTFNPGYTFGSFLLSPGLNNLPLSVPDAGVVVSVRVRINLTAFAGGNTSQIAMGLTNPNSSNLVLFTGWGTGTALTNTVIQQTGTNGAFSGGTNPFTGFWTSDNSMLALNGFNPSGNWTLSVFNGTGNNVGINNYELELNGGTLPVEMTSFSAVGGDNQVALNWHTESESNNAHFVLYRSTERDLRGDVLTQIAGHGTTATSHDYSYVDTRVQNGTTYYYRISDVDLSGIEVMHPMIIQAMPSTRAIGVIPDNYSLAQNFPNPFNPTTEFSYSLPEASSVRLSVFDAMGREVQKLVNEAQQPNVYRVHFDAAKLPSGVYFYRLTTDNFTSTKQMILMK